MNRLLAAGKFLAAQGMLMLLAAFASGQIPSGAVSSVTMTIVQSGGESTLQWKTEPGVLYTLMYATDRRPGAEWKAHPQYTRIVGDGQTITAKDRVPPGAQRYYRLHVERVADPR